MSGRKHEFLFFMLDAKGVHLVEDETTFQEIETVVDETNDDDIVSFAMHRRSGSCYYGDGRMDECDCGECDECAGDQRSF